MDQTTTITPELVEIELNIFSSRRNPSWRLRGDQVREFYERLKSLEEVNQSEVRSRLGYRGLLIMANSDAKSSEEIRVYDGVVERKNGFFADRDRCLERWLIETAGDSIPPDLREVVRADLEK